MSPVTLGLSKAGLTAGTTTTFTTANVFNFAVQSKAYSKAAVTNGATPTLDTVTGLAFKPISANQGSVVVFGFDTSGNVKCAQGDVQSLDVSGNFIVAPSFPQLNTDLVCPCGYLVLKAGSTAVGTFVFGTNNLSGVTGMTYTFQDVIALTGRPQVS
jgi:predicted secreted protein